MFGATSVPYDTLAPERIGVHPPGYRTPAETRVGTVRLQIADLERSLAFYRDVLGFRVLAREDTADGRRARLGAQQGDATLLELWEKPGARRAPQRGRLGIYHFAVLLPERGDLGRFLLHAMAQGVRVGQADHLYSEAVYLVDPDGIDVEVYRDRPRSEWQASPDGEIIGATEALDVPGLAAAANRRSWEGPPAGSTIGHMHLYVGDLERAADFYHAALGLDKVTWNFPSALFVSAGGYHHHVGLNTWAAGSPPSQDDDARLLTWELVLPDEASLATAAESLRRAGYPPTASDGGYLATDPWGITVRLVAKGA